MNKKAKRKNIQIKTVFSKLTKVFILKIIKFNMFRKNIYQSPVIFLIYPNFGC